MPKKTRSALSPLESRVMRILWARQSATAEDVQADLGPKRRLKDSTVRTVLRRLESKGYVRHIAQGRVYLYSPAVPWKEVAADVVRSVLDRFFDGSVENLLVGMVNDRLVSVDALNELTAKIAEAETRERSRKRSKS